MCMDCGSRIAEMAGDGGRTSGVPRGGREDDWRQIGDKGDGSAVGTDGERSIGRKQERDEWITKRKKERDREKYVQAR